MAPSVSMIHLFLIFVCSSGKDRAPVKLWDQELKRSKSFQIADGVVVRSVHREGKV